MTKFNPFEICFTTMKIRYADYDTMITNQHFVEPTDKVNVFINLESVFKNISTVADLERKVMLSRGFEKNIASNILNLAGHYKRFFKGNKLDTRVYLYHTDFDSDSYQQIQYNENYRTYYTCKYTQNPKFTMFSDCLREQILPLVKTCCEFIPGVYYICAHNIEGSVIPYYIQQRDKAQGTVRKNFIIGSDVFDTQYSLLPGFLNHYIKRGYGNSLVTCKIEDIIEYIDARSKDESKRMVFTYNHHSFYAALLSCMGNKLRSINGVSGIGIRTLADYIHKGLATSQIRPDTISPEIIQEIIPGSEDRKTFYHNYLCTSIPVIYENLTETEKKSLSVQISDRFDNQGFLQLNQTAFSQYQINLEMLCM